MKSNNNTAIPEQTKARWLIHKWILILWAMYYCYKCLNIYSGLAIKEVVWCTIIILRFASVIKYHQEAIEIKQRPRLRTSFSPLAGVGSLMRFIVYLILFLNVILWLIIFFLFFSLSRNTPTYHPTFNMILG